MLLRLRFYASSVVSSADRVLINRATNLVPIRMTSSQFSMRTYCLPPHCTQLFHLFPLPPIRLGIPKRKPTRPLIRARLPANPPITARKQNTPHGHRRQKRAAQRPQTEAEHARLRPHGVAVEGKGRVPDGCDGERRERVGRFGVGVGGCGAWGMDVSM